MSQTIPTPISSRTQGAVQIRRGGSSLSTVTKLPLQRLRPAISKYLKVLDIHLHRLHQHQCNMEKLVKMESWTLLHVEQVNAARTVQQIKATLQELQLTRTRVVDNQVGNYRALVKDFVDKVTGSPDMFQFICQEEQPKSIISNTAKTKPSTSTQGQMVTTSTCIVPDNSAAAACRDQLRQEMKELQAMVQHFIHTVTVTHTEAGESTLKENSEFMPARTADNKTADKTKPLKIAVMPVVGALLGGAVAGPVGVFTGIEIGTLAGTVGGGVVGLVGSTILSSQDETSSEVADLNHNIDSTTKDAHKSTSQPSPTPQAPITQQSSLQQTSSTSASSSKQSAPQTSPTQSHDSRHDQPCTDSNDNNGNMSLLDRILFFKVSD